MHKSAMEQALEKIAYCKEHRISYLNLSDLGLKLICQPYFIQIASYSKQPFQFVTF